MSDYGYDGRAQKNQRDQQIAELRKHNPVARQTQTSQQTGTTAFSIDLQLKDRTIITMRIALGKEFPQAPPVIQMLSKVSHPWLSRDGYFCVIGHRGLQNWNMHSNLGRVVSEIVTEFCARPPARMNQTANVPAPSTSTVTQQQQQQQQQQPSYQPPPTNNTPLGITNHHQTNSSSRGNNNNSNNNNGGGNMPPTYSTGSNGSKVTNAAPFVVPPPPTKTWTVPAIASTFPEVHSLNATEIQNLMDDDEAFDTFCSTVNGVQKLTTLVATLREKNGQAAETNLSHEEKIVSCKTEIETLHTNLKEKKKKYDALVERQRVVLSKSSPEELIKKLQQNAEQLEMESEELADEYVNDDYDGNQKKWQKEFLQSKKMFHRRKAMIARYKQLNNMR